MMSTQHRELPATAKAVGAQLGGDSSACPSTGWVEDTKQVGQVPKRQVLFSSGDVHCGGAGLLPKTAPLGTKTGTQLNSFPLMVPEQDEPFFLQRTSCILIK